jgi:putative heme-binding domain-containing protein
LGPVHALYALASLGAASEADVLFALGAPLPETRRHALRVAEAMLDSPAVRERVYQAARDEDAAVRRQAAFTLGLLDTPQVVDALERVARRDGANPWSALAVLCSARGRAAAVAEALARQSDWRAPDPARGGMLEALAQQAGRQAQRAEMPTLLAAVRLVQTQDASLAERMLLAYVRGLAAVRSPLAEEIRRGAGRAGELLASARRRALALAGDENASLSRRVEAIAALAAADFAETREVLASLLDSRQPAPLQIAALRTLARYDPPEVAGVVIGAWAHLSPQVRGEAIETLFAREDRLPALLAAIDEKKIAPADLDPARIKLLLSRSPDKAQQLARSVLGRALAGTRDEVLRKYQGSLSRPGDPGRGKLAFQKTCASCHKLDGAGHEVGPDLAALRNRGADAILLALLDPNREVNPQYVNYSLRTLDGSVATGIIAAETATSVTLRRAEGVSESILRADIDELRSSGLSLMPEGLEKQLSVEDVADLIAYLLAPR